MPGVHLAPRHAQHSAPRHNHARTRVQCKVATEHSRVQCDTATDKLQHGAVHHHRPPTSHHGHEGNARHNQHGPHEPQARQHQHRCVRRGLRAGKIHKRRRPRGNQQGVRHRQHGPRGERAGQHKRTVQRLHIAHRQLHRPALVAPRRTAPRNAPPPITYSTAPFSSDTFCTTIRTPSRAIHGTWSTGLTPSSTTWRSVTSLAPAGTTNTDHTVTLSRTKTLSAVPTAGGSAGAPTGTHASPYPPLPHSHSHTPFLMLADAVPGA
ncbi:hypothetical protein ECC02_005561 [Trypanosoma cruzi]|uniref:Uncharacterized protein n=1 Tax=Trypanosoma cruzi TaxID=5693 RepID=A0A7J6Y3Q4_TRYCR|nr:hypothetical protein ECC02_005561 [Trypanosoma cruzi]